jgi:hypothetical protein
MKRINSNELLNGLSADVRQLILQATQLQSLPPHRLTQSPSANRWSVAQVLEHLNIYGRYYIPAIEQKLHLHQTVANSHFKPGWLGNYFTHLMLPKADRSIPKKMKAPSNALPSPQPDATAQLQAFIRHQHHLLNLLEIARSANLNTIRIPTSLNKLIQLKLGDTFRFFIAHEQRHWVQIEGVLKVNGE